MLIIQHINLVLLDINFVCNNGERILHNMIQLRVLYIYYLGYLGWILIWCIGKYFGEYIDDRGSFRITVIKFVFNIHFLLEMKLCIITTGCPKKFKLIFEFFTLERLFLGVKDNSKNFENKKILGCLAKF